MFETLLVARGEPLELDAHLARMGSSTRDLYGEGPPDDAAALVREHARALSLGRLRLDVVPDGDGKLAPTVKAADVQPALVFPSWEGAVALAPVVVPGGIGGHKWSDRRLLDQAQADCGDAVPVVLDDDRGVLEISRGNVFVASGGALLTPPADGRLLPGVARRRVIEVAAEAGIEVREQAIAEDELVAADEVFVTGSVRGVEPVRAYADARRWEEGRLTPLVSAALRRRWLPDGDPDYTRPT